MFRQSPMNRPCKLVVVFSILPNPMSVIIVPLKFNNLKFLQSDKFKMLKDLRLDTCSYSKLTRCSLSYVSFYVIKATDLIFENLRTFAYNRYFSHKLAFSCWFA